MAMKNFYICDAGGTLIAAHEELPDHVTMAEIVTKYGYPGQAKVVVKEVNSDPKIATKHTEVPCIEETPSVGAKKEISKFAVKFPNIPQLAKLKANLAQYDVAVVVEP
jgi:hypothetical protein